MARDPQGDSGPTGPEPVTPKAQRPSGGVERVVRDEWVNRERVTALENAVADAVEVAKLQEDRDTTGIWANRAERWRAALRAAPAASPGAAPCNPDTGVT